MLRCWCGDGNTPCAMVQVFSSRHQHLNVQITSFVDVYGLPWLSANEQFVHLSFASFLEAPYGNFAPVALAVQGRSKLQRSWSRLDLQVLWLLPHLLDLGYRLKGGEPSPDCVKGFELSWKRVSSGRWSPNVWQPWSARLVVSWQRALELNQGSVLFGVGIAHLSADENAAGLKRWSSEGVN